MKQFAAVCACLAVGAFLVAAQTAPPPSTASQTPTFKAGGEEVVLDVVVRDKKGKLVKDLKPEDFQVTDNGEKRTIKSFRLVEGSEAVSSSGGRTQLDPLRQIRLVTLIFHGLDQNGRLLSRQAALDLIKSELSQNVFMSVLDIDHTLEAIQPFTNDRALLKKAIERATGGSNDFASDTVLAMNQLEQMAGPLQGGPTSIDDRVAGMSNGASGSSGPSAAPNGSSAANTAMAQIMLSMMNASKQDATTDQGRGAIFSLLDAVKEQYRLPGRKTILLFTSGFTKPQGTEQLFQSIISMANRSNVSFYAIDARGLTIRSTSQNALDDLASGAAASRANATPGGGVTRDMAQSVDTSMDAGNKDTQNVLGQLANQTGGELIANTNDFRAPLRRVEEDIQTYYEISYDPQISNYDGAFRKVSVKTDEANLRVHSRSGYFALPPSLVAGGQAIAPFEIPLLKALDEKPLRKDFAFQSAGMHYRDDSGASTGEVVLDVPIGNLTLQQNKATGDYEGKFAYVAMVKDSHGQVIKKLRNEVPLKITPDKLAAYKAGHFVFAEPIELKSGRYTLDAAILDVQGEKISTRKSSFIVPAQEATLSISSIAVVRNTKPADQNEKPGDPLLFEHQVITPSVNPVIKKSDAQGLPFYVVVYEDKTNKDKPGLVMEFSKDGQVLGNVPAALGAPDAQGRIQFVTTAPIAKLDPGDYQVRFIAKQGDEAAVESVTFTLEP
jgi:VWFA-related protein